MLLKHSAISISISLSQHIEKCDQIVIMLLTNHKDCAPELSPHQVEPRKRQRQFGNDEGDDDDSSAVDHQIISIKSNLEMRNQVSKKSPVGIGIKRRRSDHGSYQVTC